MTYNMLVYNVPDGVTVDGTVATVNGVQTKDRTSSIEIEATPDCLFGAYRQVTIAEDDMKFTFSLGDLIHSGTFNVTTGTAAIDESATKTTSWDITACNHPPKCLQSVTFTL